MGFLRPDYNKFGKGIEKDAPEKNRFLLFFEILWNQRSKLVYANLCYFVAMLPLVLALILTFEIDVSSPSLIKFKDGGIDILAVLLFLVSVFVSFPATMGFTYILRNIQRRQHSWIWHDFISQTRINYLNGVKNGAVTLLVYYLFINAYTIYQNGIMGNSTYVAVFTALTLVLMIVFTWMQFYVNTMAITFDLKMRQIYKNAFIFALGNLPLNLLISIVCIALALVIYLFPILYLAGIFFVYALFGFIVVFAVYPVIDKHMISRADENEESNKV